VVPTFEAGDEARQNDRQAIKPTAASLLVLCVFHLKVIIKLSSTIHQGFNSAVYLTFQVTSATMKFTLALGAILATTAAAFAPAAVAPRAVAVSTTAVK